MDLSMALLGQWRNEAYKENNRRKEKIDMWRSWTGRPGLAQVGLAPFFFAFSSSFSVFFSIF
jgi:hypothetical protein